MVLEEIAELVDGLDLHATSEDLRAAFAIRDSLDAKLALAVAEFEATDQHTADGAATMASWLTANTGRDRTTAQRTVLTGRKLRAFPVLAGAVLNGTLTGGQVDVILAHVPARHAGLWAEHEADVVSVLAGADLDVTRRAMETWRARADALDAGPEPAEHPNHLHLSRTLDGRREVRGSFDPDLGALVDTALRVADRGDHDQPLSVRRAEALGQVCQTFLDTHDHVAGRHRPHVNIVVDVDDLETGVGARYVDTDAPVSPEAYAVIRCDATLRRVLLDADGSILDYGRATRDWAPALFNAIVLRDRGCRFPGCDAPTHWCDVHHVKAWEHGGDTSLDNGALLCRRHHTRIHAAGWHAKLLPDGTIEVTSPDGRVLTSHPRGRRQAALFREPAGS